MKYAPAVARDVAAAETIDEKVSSRPFFALFSLSHETRGQQRFVLYGRTVKRRSFSSALEAFSSTSVSLTFHGRFRSGRRGESTVTRQIKRPRGLAASQDNGCCTPTSASFLSAPKNRHSLPSACRAKLINEREATRARRRKYPGQTRA